MAATLRMGDVPVGETFRFLDTDRSGYWRRISDGDVLEIDPKTGGPLVRCRMGAWGGSVGSGETTLWGFGPKAAARPVELVEFVPARWAVKNGSDRPDGAA